MSGGITPDNARTYLEAGTSHVIVTFYLFQDGQLDMERLRALHAAVGRERLVLDLSCWHREGCYWVVTDRWQRFTTTALDAQTLAELSSYCAEFLVHGVDVEELRLEIEGPLVELLGVEVPIPVTHPATL